MKFTLKKILYYAFIIFLVWFIYKMFFRQFLEGMSVDCSKYKSKNRCKKHNKLCNWKNKKCVNK